jgi:hypothetical protein
MRHAAATALRHSACASFGSEYPQRGSGDEVALKVEGVVNRGVHAQEALSTSPRSARSSSTSR